MSAVKKKINSDKDSEKEYEAQLIEHIAKRPFLYDKTHEYYSKFQLRIDAWKEISEDFNKPVKELKKKWETLRDTYRKFYKKMSNRINEGKGLVKWVHFDNMKFLNGHIKLDEIHPSEQAEVQKEFDVKLIEEISKCKNLYDPMNETFRNMKERANTWDNISRIMDESIEVCKKRWNYLKETFKKFNKKVIEDSKEINWVHYDSLKFLLEFESVNVSEIRPSSDIENSSPKSQMHFEFKSLPPITNILIKSENDLENIDCIEYSTGLNEDAKPSISLELPQKCGEILITKTEKFSYKCCACDNILEHIENFIKHILDSHMGRNGGVSIFEVSSKDNFQTNNIESDYFNDIDKHDDSSEEEEETETETIEKKDSAVEKRITKTTLKYYKSDTREKRNPQPEEDLKENPNDDPETAAVKRIKRRYKTVKIGKIGKFPCSTCSFSFDKEENLRKHEENHRQSVTCIFEQKKEVGDLSCDHCDRKFQYKYQLQRHKRLHTGERPFQCTICDEKFRHNDTLKEHYIFRHSEDRPYTCRHEGCDKKFKTRKTRSFHEVVHSNEMPFQCDECGKCFPKNSYLKRHRNTWHMDKNDRPYKCPHCTKSFCTQHNLKYHIYTHTGERPFSCSVCPAKFTKAWSVKEHMKVHSGEKNYSCQICGKNFARRAGLIRHVRTHGDIAINNIEINPS